MAAIFVVVLVLWVTEALPVGMTALLAVVLLPIFGVADLPTAFRTFISPVFFFVLAMFVVAQAFISSGSTDASRCGCSRRRAPTAAA